MAAAIHEIQGFLDAVTYREVHPRAPGEKPGRHPFVTISRQAGAGGHTLAHVLVRQMQHEQDPIFQGWQVFDRELCERLMADPRLHVSMQSLLTEEYRSEIEDAIFSLVGGQTPRDVVVRRLFETIRTLATVGRVVIVGRAGMCVTRDLPDGVHVRLVASGPARVQRMMQLLHLDEAGAREAVDRQDRDRARLVREHFSREIHDPLLYDVTWNTDSVSFEAMAASIIALIKHRGSRVQDLVDGAPMKRSP